MSLDLPCLPVDKGRKTVSSTEKLSVRGFSIVCQSSRAGSNFEQHRFDSDVPRFKEECGTIHFAVFH